MVPVAGIVFDMDDTLYLERDYVRSGFLVISEFLETAGEVSADRLFKDMIEIFKHGNRRTVFNQVLLKWPQLQSIASVDKLVQIYRNHEPDICLLPGIEDLIVGLRNQGIRIGLISDGFAIAQQAKFRALGIEELVDLAIFTDVWGRDFWKPHSRAFELTAARWGVPHSALVYVGDNPAKDFVAPLRLGWHTIRLKIPGQIHENGEAYYGATAAEYECTSISSLAELLRIWVSRD